KIVLQKLLMDMMSFYSVHYILVSLRIGIFRVDSLLAHLDYTTKPSWQIWIPCTVTVISTELTYLSGGLTFAWIVEEWIWDYAIPVKLIHIDLTVAGKQQEIEARGEESHCPMANDDGELQHFWQKTFTLAFHQQQNIQLKLEVYIHLSQIHLNSFDLSNPSKNSLF
uniref:Uncharacterized protein n=1 Tax=Oncorhynchus tshawytscha TaxID=74940 RepID=A0A8C8J567_ONCTS